LAVRVVGAAPFRRRLQRVVRFFLGDALDVGERRHLHWHARQVHLRRHFPFPIAARALGQRDDANREQSDDEGGCTSHAGVLHGMSTDYHSVRRRLMMRTLCWLLIGLAALAFAVGTTLAFTQQVYRLPPVG